MNQTIEDVRSFIEDHRRGDSADKPVFWSLHYSNTSKISSKSQRAAKNFESGDIEESMDLLERAIMRLSRQGYRYMLVSLRASPTDSQPVEFPFQNESGSGINGLGMQQSNNGAMGSLDVVNLMRSQFEQQIAGLNQLTEMRMNAMRQEFERAREIQDLKDQISGMEAAKMSRFDRLLESPAGEVLMNKILGVVLGMGDDEEREEPQRAGPVQEREELHQAGPVQGQSAEQEKLIASLQKMGKHFQNLPDVLSKLADFVDNNPEDAKLYLNALK